MDVLFCFRFVFEIRGHGVRMGRLGITVVHWRTCEIDSGSFCYSIRPLSEFFGKREEGISFLFFSFIILVVLSMIVRAITG